MRDGQTPEFYNAAAKQVADTIEDFLDAWHDFHVDLYDGAYYEQVSNVAGISGEETERRLVAIGWEPAMSSLYDAWSSLREHVECSGPDYHARSEARWAERQAGGPF